MIIDKILSRSINLWLRSRISAVENLNTKVLSKDRQIIRGVIPKVLIEAGNAVYQQLYISEIKIEGTDIKVNLPQIIKKKPFKLLQPIVIKVKVLLKEEDLKKSLSSPLLSAGLTDIWNRLLSSHEIEPDRFYANYQWNDFSLSESSVYFNGISSKPEDNYEIKLSTKIQIGTTHSLLILPKSIITIPEQNLNIKRFMTVDLGDRASITYLEITSEYLSIEGTITVFP